MSQKHRQGYDENSNVAAPMFFTDAMSDLAGEFNGGLDRDNLPAADIVARDVVTDVVRPFNMLHTIISPTGVALNKAVTEWQAGFGRVTWTAKQDAHYDVHCSIGWSWDGNYSWDLAGVRPNRTDTFDTILIRITVNGETIATAGPFEDGALKWATYLTGAIQLPAGRHIVQLEALVVRRVAQSGELAGPCRNTVTIEDRYCVLLERKR